MTTKNQTHLPNPKLAKGQDRVRVLRKKIRNLEKRGITDGIRMKRLNAYKDELSMQ